MPAVIYILQDGERRVIDVPAGTSIMRGAVDHDLSGIVGECGGELTCASCHVHVEDACYDRFPVPDLAEMELLEMVEDYRPTSRLSCQLVLRDDLDGTIVTVP